MRAKSDKGKSGTRTSTKGSRTTPRANSQEVPAASSLLTPSMDLEGAVASLAGTTQAGTTQAKPSTFGIAYTQIQGNEKFEGLKREDVAMKPNAVTILNEVLDKIANELSSLDIPEISRVEGARLAESWLSECSAFDAQFPTVAVEIPFFMILDKYTIVVGMQDRISMDQAGLFGCEWKTTKGTTKFWNQEKWLDSMTRGVQIGVYALGLHEAFFVQQEKSTEAMGKFGEFVVGQIGGPMLWQPKVEKPRIMVRAITKEHPPVIWPNDWESTSRNLFEISPRKLTVIRDALAIRGDQIRVAKLRKSTPWQLTGMQCQDRFHWSEMCPHYPDCSAGKFPQPNETSLNLISPTDPGGQALIAAASMLRVPLNDERVVVLSASSYDESSDCFEKYRRTTIQGEKEDMTEMFKGQAFHKAVATYYQGV